MHTSGVGHEIKRQSRKIPAYHIYRHLTNMNTNTKNEFMVPAENKLHNHQTVLYFTYLIKVMKSLCQYEIK